MLMRRSTSSVPASRGAGSTIALAIALFTVLCSTTSAQPIGYAWTRTLPMPGDFFSYTGYGTVKVYMDAAGNSYVAAAFRDSMDLDDSPAEHWVNAAEWGSYVAKYDADGEVLWSVVFSSYLAARTVEVMDLAISEATGTLIVLGMAGGSFDVDPGPGVVDVTGFYSNCATTWVAQLDLDGNYTSHMKLGTGLCGATVVSLSAAFTPDDQLVIGGQAYGQPDFDPNGTLTFPSTNWAPFVAKYSLPFDLVWAHIMAGADGYVSDVEVAANGDIAVVGSAECSNCDFDPSAANSATNLNPFYSTAFMAKYSATSELLWVQRAMGTNGGILAATVRFDPDGALYLTGEFSFQVNNADMDPGPGTALVQWGGPPVSSRFLSKFDAAGAYQWSQLISDRSDNSATRRAAATIAGDAVYVIGGHGTNTTNPLCMAPGGDPVQVEPCTDPWNSQVAHFLAAFDRSTGVLLAIYRDTLFCADTRSTELDLAGNASGGLVMMGITAETTNFALNLGEDMLNPAVQSYFLSRFNSAGLPTQAPELSGTAQELPMHLRILDMRGALITVISGAAMQQAVDTWGLAPGIYLQQAVHRDGSSTARRIVAGQW